MPEDDSSAVFFRRWQAAKAAPKGPGENARPGLRGEVMRLQSELDAAQRKIGRLRRGYDEGNDSDWQDTPEDIAKAMLRLYPNKAKRVGAAILILEIDRPRNRAQRDGQP
jgi:hypothetical protein